MRRGNTSNSNSVQTPMSKDEASFLISNVSIGTDFGIGQNNRSCRPTIPFVCIARPSFDTSIAFDKIHNPSCKFDWLWCRSAGKNSDNARFPTEREAALLPSNVRLSDLRTTAYRRIRRCPPDSKYTFHRHDISSLNIDLNIESSTFVLADRSMFTLKIIDQLLDLIHSLLADFHFHLVLRRTNGRCELIERFSTYGSDEQKEKNDELAETKRSHSEQNVGKLIEPTVIVADICLSCFLSRSGSCLLYTSPSPRD